VHWSAAEKTTDKTMKLEMDLAELTSLLVYFSIGTMTATRARCAGQKEAIDQKIADLLRVTQLTPDQADRLHSKLTAAVIEAADDPVNCRLL